MTLDIAELFPRTPHSRVKALLLLLLIVSKESAVRPVPATPIDDTTPLRSLLSRSFSAHNINITSPFSSQRRRLCWAICLARLVI
jgi:hypothetical protein